MNAVQTELFPAAVPVKPKELYEIPRINWEEEIKKLKASQIPDRCAVMEGILFRCAGCEKVAHPVHSPLDQRAAAVRFFCPGCCPVCQKIKREEWTLCRQAS